MKHISYLNFIIFVYLFSFILLSISCKSNEEQNPTLKSNHELWAKNNICSYKMTLEASNLNPTGFNSPVDMEIQNGKVLNIELSSKPNNEKLTVEQKEFIQNQYKEILTIEQLFDFAKFATNEKQKLIEANRSNVVALEISYDSQYGYPKQITYSRSDKMHSYKNFKVKKFESLKSGNSCN